MLPLIALPRDLLHLHSGTFFFVGVFEYICMCTFITLHKYTQTFLRVARLKCFQGDRLLGYDNTRWED